MLLITKIRALLRLSEATRRADRAHRITGERYYVIPSGKKANLIIMDRSNFRKFKQKRYINNKAHISDLEKDCFYCSGYRNGNGTLPKAVIKMKRQMYLDYVRAQAKRLSHKKVTKSVTKKKK